MVSSAAALAWQRDRTALLVAGYFLSYEALLYFLQAVDLYQITSYMAIAVAIDWWFFYQFAGRRAKFAAAGCALSLFYGGLTVIEHQAAGSLLYAGYEYMAIIASLLILFDGVSRAISYRHDPTSSGWTLHGRIASWFSKLGKKAIK